MIIDLATVQQTQACEESLLAQMNALQDTEEILSLGLHLKEMRELKCHT